jgi:hypothetical protein
VARLNGAMQHHRRRMRPEETLQPAVAPIAATAAIGAFLLESLASQGPAPVRAGPVMPVPGLRYPPGAPPPAARVTLPGHRQDGGLAIG